MNFGKVKITLNKIRKATGWEKITVIYIIGYGKQDNGSPKMSNVLIPATSDYAILHGKGN